MKAFRWFWFLVVVGFGEITGSVRAAPGSSELEENHVLDCGAEKVVVLGGTNSKDNRYVVAWTLRPNGTQPPVDWRKYHGDNHQFFDLYPPRDEEGDWHKAPYLAVNGLVDLRTRKFTPFLPAESPFVPNMNRRDLTTLWSGGEHGTRHLVVTGESRYSTDDLWLITMEPNGDVHLRNVIKEADAAVKPYVRKRYPKTYQNHTTTYNQSEVELAPLEYTDVRNATLPADQTRSVKVPFSSYVPKGEDYETVDGYITFAWPDGKVVGVTKRTTP